jgi:hypothetical protein
MYIFSEKTETPKLNVFPLLEEHNIGIVEMLEMFHNLFVIIISLKEN